MFEKENLLLEVKDLHIPLLSKDGAGASIPMAVDGVDLAIWRGRALCLVGESGSGKSAVCRAIANLMRQPGLVASGRLLVYPQGSPVHMLDLATTSPKQKEKSQSGGMIPGITISMIAQETLPALSKLRTIGSQIIQAVQMNRKVGKPEARRRAIGLMAALGIPFPDRLAREYPIHLAKETRLRVVLAMALACEPALLIIDDPAAMLDLPNRPQVLEQIAAMQQELGMAVLYATHDLHLAERLGDAIAVMRHGKIVEMADVQTLFSGPEHPYTQALLDGRSISLKSDSGSSAPAQRVWPPSGCAYHPFCPQTMPACAQFSPRLVTVGEHHDVRCFLHEPLPVEPLQLVEQHEPDSDVWQLERFLMK